MKKLSLALVAFISLNSYHSTAQKVPPVISNGNQKVQSAINEVNSTINTVSAAANTAKSLGNILHLGKSKKKKNAEEKMAATPPVVIDSALAVAVIVAFTKTDYMTMKQVKDELLKDSKIKDVKINYNTDNKNFLTIKHVSKMDKILETVLTTCGNKYDVMSASADAIILKVK